MKLSKNLQKNIDFIKSKLVSDDIKYREFMTASQQKAIVIYTDGLVNKAEINEFVIKALQENPQKIDEVDTCLENILQTSENEEVFDCENCILNILDGNCILMVDGLQVAISVGAKKYNTRSISEPPTTTVVKGPREGFVEDLKNNLSMLRRKLKTEKLVITNLKCGEYSNTNVSICSIKGVANDDLRKEIEEKIKQIKTDGIFDSSYIAKHLEKRNGSIFKQIGNSEKPDVVAARLLEGKVAIIVDGSPIVLTLPYMILEDFQNPEDYFERKYRATFARIIRILGVLISCLLPAFFVASQVFNILLIPLRFTITVLNSVKGLPLTPAVEMLFVVLIFEILNEASIRMPKYVGMALSVVGALVLGETAVRAGIVSAPTLMIMALSAISLYTVPELNGTLSMIRIVFILLAGTIGIYGILLGIVFLFVYLCSMKSFNTPILYPYAPFNKFGKEDGIVLKN